MVAMTTQHLGNPWIITPRIPHPVRAAWRYQAKPIAGGTELSKGSALQKVGGQATKGTRRMPWRQMAKKDVVSCEKLRGVANRLRSGDLRMGKPGGSHIPSPLGPIHKPSRANGGN